MTTNNEAAPQASNQRETASKSQNNNSSSPTKHQDQTSISSQVRAQFKAGGNSTASQRFRILRYLQLVGPATTHQFRHLLDVMHPGMRVCELRKAGHHFLMVWVNDWTPEGNVHRVGKYIVFKKRQISHLAHQNATVSNEGINE